MSLHQQCCRAIREKRVCQKVVFRVLLLKMNAAELSTNNKNLCTRCRRAEAVGKLDCIECRIASHEVDARTLHIFSQPEGVNEINVKPRGIHSRTAHYDKMCDLIYFNAFRACNALFRAKHTQRKGMLTKNRKAILCGREGLHVPVVAKKCIM